jgi:hypothetical protein
MSENPIPHGEQYHSCILKERYRSATGMMSKMLSRLFPLPNKGASQTSSPEKAGESMANEKSPPNPELECP